MGHDTSYSILLWWRLIHKTGNDPELVCLGQTLELSSKPELTLAQLFAPGLEFLRQPPTAMRSGQGLGDVLRLGEQRAEILPDQVVEPLRRCKACQHGSSRRLWIGSALPRQI
jgi:hypothetical protein